MDRHRPCPNGHPPSYMRGGGARFLFDGKNIYEDKEGYKESAGTKWGHEASSRHSNRHGEGERHRGRSPRGRNGYGGDGRHVRSPEEEEKEHDAILAQVREIEMLEANMAERLGYGGRERPSSTHSYVRERPPGSRKKAEPYYASSDTESTYSTDTDSLADQVQGGRRDYGRFMGRSPSGLSNSESESSYSSDPPPRMARSGRRMGGYPDPYSHGYRTNFGGYECLLKGPF
ncbi:MAG: hypothetical protein Q9167_005607 [Letrouitia subvulpina]